jgi:hypothetical protein
MNFQNIYTFDKIFLTDKTHTPSVINKQVSQGLLLPMTISEEDKPCGDNGSLV